MNNLLDTFIDRYGYLLDLCGKSDWDFEDIENYLVRVGIDNAPKDLIDRAVDDMTDDEIKEFQKKLSPEDRRITKEVIGGLL